MTTLSPSRVFVGSRSCFFAVAILVLAPGLLYGQFLGNPVVFDDASFFDGTVHRQYLGKIFSLNPRWLPYATLEWTRQLLGLELIWFHLGNVALHVANVLLIYFFARRLFEAVLPKQSPDVSRGPVQSALSASWLAFFAALIFALHPAAVYAVSYLTQRSTLMATFFVLIMWRMVLEGALSSSRGWLIASAGAYFFAVFAKEHAIMASAAAFTLCVLLRKSFRDSVKLGWPAWCIYTAIALFVIFRAREIIGQAYEPFAADMLARVTPAASLHWPAHLLSVVTQGFLYFKYLLLWMLPSPAWMAVDIYEDFATTPWSWPQLGGFILFLVYPLVAVRVLLKGGAPGLLGFAALCPWLLFATEFSAVRIQESFVLYRSYLWMAGLVIGLPLLLHRVPAQRAAVMLTTIAVLLVPLAWNRLTTFSHPLLLWDDAAQLASGKEHRPGVERIYYNRGNSFARLKKYQEAIDDYTKAIHINHEYTFAFDGRGTVRLLMGKYQLALDDFNQAIKFHPEYYRPYLGRAQAHEALHQIGEAVADYRESCSRNILAACERLQQLTKTH